MRLDLLLDSLCLFKTRSQAARACAEGRVLLNGLPARASKEVRAGDRVRWIDPLGRLEQEIEVLEVPSGRVSKGAARDLYTEIARREIDDPWVRG